MSYKPHPDGYPKDDSEEFLSLMGRYKTIIIEYECAINMLSVALMGIVNDEGCTYHYDKAVAFAESWLEAHGISIPAWAEGDN